jgi:hypothetical protein
VTDPAILFVKPKAISQRDKKALQSAGVIVVEVENPSDMRLTRANADLSSTQLLVCATQAIAGSGSDYVKVLFAKAICAAISAAPNDASDR